MTLKVHQVCGIGFDSNVYFIDAEKPLIIDAGTGARNKSTLENVNKHRNSDKLTKLILTHNHVDHSGGAKGLSDELGVKVFAHELDGKALQDGDAGATGALMFGQDQPKVDVQTIGPGDTIDCGEFELKVLHTPGHSPGSISLYDEDSRSLFCGDLVFMDGGVGRWDLPGGNYKQLVKSFSEVLKLEVDNFYSGHGSVCEGKGQEYIELSYRYLKSCAAFEDF